MPLRVKRIIDGKTYNTETATQLASWSSADSPDTARFPEHGGVLFQTRFGAYFVVQYDERQDPWDDNYEKLIPLEPEQAQRWAEKHCPVDVVEAVFGEMPEAGAAEAKLTLRMPEALRKRLVALAEARKQSLNAWIVRCLEGCAASAEKPARKAAVTGGPPARASADDGPDAPEVPNRITAAPRLGNVYWCEFPMDARKPEFWKTRPVIVVSYANTLLGPVLVVPLTTKPQPGNRWAHALPRNPVPGESRASWAVCNHLYTVSCSRLSPVHGKVGRLDEAERRPVIELARRWLASPEVPTTTPAPRKG